MPHSIRQNQQRRGAQAREAYDVIIPGLLRAMPELAKTHTQIIRPMSPSAAVLNKPASITRKPRITVQSTDTLSAARYLTFKSERAKLSGKKNVCVLIQSAETQTTAMAGFFSGASSQENFLCQRSTLSSFLLQSPSHIISDNDMFHAGVFVFADSSTTSRRLAIDACYKIDVISAGLEPRRGSTIDMRDMTTYSIEDSEGSLDACTCGISYCDAHRDAVLKKMTSILTFADSRGIEQLVLNAWGCGALGHDPGDLAKLWRRALFGTVRSQRTWASLKEVVFAIDNPALVRPFRTMFADVEDKSDWAQKSWNGAFDAEPASISEENRAAIDRILDDISRKEARLQTSRSGDTRRQLRIELSQLRDELSTIEQEQDQEMEDNFVFVDRHEAPVELQRKAETAPAVQRPAGDATYTLPSLPTTPSPMMKLKSVIRVDGNDDENEWFHGSVDELHRRMRSISVSAPVARPAVAAPQKRERQGPPSPETPYSPY